MKILYISGNQRSQQFPWLTDYQDDCLLLGLKELFGDDVVDVNKKYKVNDKTFNCKKYFTML